MTLMKILVMIRPADVANAGRSRRMSDDRGEQIRSSASKGELTQLKSLLQGPDPPLEAKDSNGWTPLIGAAFGGHRGVVDFLLEKGADIEARDNNGWSALMYAAYWGHHKIVERLLERRADTEARNKDGWTVLMCAAAGKGRKAQVIVEQLLAKGADESARDNQGKTAEGLASSDDIKAVLRVRQRRAESSRAPGSSARVRMSLHNAGTQPCEPGGCSWQSKALADIVSCVLPSGGSRGNRAHRNSPRSPLRVLCHTRPPAWLRHRHLRAAHLRRRGVNHRVSCPLPRDRRCADSRVREPSHLDGPASRTGPDLRGGGGECGRAWPAQRALLLRATW
jgi:hypothetical protein